MPIVFAQPSPFAPSVLQSYGAAEVANRNLPVLERQGEAIADARRQQVAQELQARQIASEADVRLRQIDTQRAGLAQEGSLAREGMAQRERLAFGDHDLHAAQFQAGLQQEGAMADRRAQAAAWLQGQELSQQESMRLQRLQAAVGTVQDRVAAGDLSADEGANMIMEIRTGIDPLRRRLEASQAKRQDELAQRALEQAKVQALHAKTMQDVLATNPEQRLSSHQLADGTYLHRFMGGDGKEHVSFSKPDAGPDKAKLQQQRLDAARALKGHLTADQYFKEYNAAAHEVDTRKKNGENIPAEERAAFVASALEARGLGKTWQEHNARQLRELTEAGLLGGPEQGGGGDFGGGQPQRTPPNPEEVKAGVAAIEHSVGTLFNMPELQPQEKHQGVTAARQAQGLYQKVGGDLSKLAPQEAMLYDNAMALQNALIRLGRERRKKPAGKPLLEHLDQPPLSS